MQYRIVLALAFVIGGCAIAPVQESLSPSPQAKKVFPSLEGINKALPGMTQQEVKSLAGQDLVIGYAYQTGKPEDRASYKTITVPNPYKTETVKRASKNYVVEYYLTQIIQADGAVTDDELTPLIFENGRCVGKGWDFYNQNVKQP